MSSQFLLQFIFLLATLVAATAHSSSSSSQSSSLQVSSVAVLPSSSTKELKAAPVSFTCALSSPSSSSSRICTLVVSTDGTARLFQHLSPSPSSSSDSANTKLIWTRKFSAGIRATPLLLDSNRKAFFSLENGESVCVSLLLLIDDNNNNNNNEGGGGGGGKVLWKKSLARGFGFTAAKVSFPSSRQEELIVAPFRDQDLTILSSSNGQVRGTIKNSDGVWSQPTIYKNKIEKSLQVYYALTASTKIAVAALDSFLSSSSSSSSQDQKLSSPEKWSYDVLLGSSLSSSSPASSASSVSWRARVPKWIWTSVLVVPPSPDKQDEENCISIFGNVDGTLRAVKNGRLLWSFATSSGAAAGGISATPVQVDEEYFAAVSNSGVLVKCRIQHDGGAAAGGAAKKNCVFSKYLGSALTPSSSLFLIDSVKKYLAVLVKATSVSSGSSVVLVDAKSGDQILKYDLGSSCLASSASLSTLSAHENDNNNLVIFSIGCKNGVALVLKIVHPEFQKQKQQQQRKVRIVYTDAVPIIKDDFSQQNNNSSSHVISTSNFLVAFEIIGVVLIAGFCLWRRKK